MNSVNYFFLFMYTFVRVAKKHFIKYFKPDKTYRYSQKKDKPINVKMKNRPNCTWS